MGVEKSTVLRAKCQEEYTLDPDHEDLIKEEVLNRVVYERDGVPKSWRAPFMRGKRDSSNCRQGHKAKQGRCMLFGQLV